MNGILNILKPAGMTSFDVVACLRGILKIKKIGHAGTLDPIAAGVLPVCVGKATKAIEYMMDKDKLYRAELTLGITTDTQDSSGEILSTSNVNCSDQSIAEAVKSFTGKYKQLPPMYSAIKINGKKLYELARKGETIERTAREVEIYSTDIIRITRSEHIKVLFDVHCSKGTYIRTLCSDIGEKLGCGGHMSFLLRKRAGIFLLDDTVTLEEVKKLAEEDRLAETMIDVDCIFTGYKQVVLDASQVKKLLNGVPVLLGPGFETGSVRVYEGDNKFLALGEIYKDNDTTKLKTRKIF